MKRYLISLGGSGTGSIQTLLGDKVNYPPTLPYNNAHERDFTKPLKGSKVVYLIANPYDIILSHFRRDFLKSPYEGAQLLGSGKELLSKKRRWLLEDFLDLKKDPMKFKEHFCGWFNHKERNYDILFAKYDYLNKSIFDICTFYNIGEEVAKSYTFRKRNVSYLNQSKEIQEKLQNMYGDLFEIYQNLEPIIINPSHNIGEKNNDK